MNRTVQDLLGIYDNMFLKYMEYGVYVSKTLLNHLVDDSGKFPEGSYFFWDIV